MAKGLTGDAELDSWIDEELKGYADDIQQKARWAMGHDTNALDSSITVEKEGNDYYIAPDIAQLTSDSRNTRSRDYSKYHHNYVAYMDIALNSVKS